MDTFISPENDAPSVNNNENDFPLTDFEIYDTNYGIDQGSMIHW